jgi:tetratricopeptide (TPR) repeat protein
MSARIAPAAPALAALVLALLAGGCGSDVLWTRFRAERDLWRAQRMVEKLRVRPRLASAADVEHAIAAFRAIATAYPAERWARGERLGEPNARDLAGISGEAWIAVGRLEEKRHRRASALAIYDRVIADYDAGWDAPGEEARSVARPAVRYDRLGQVRLNAMLARAALLERAGRSQEALAARERIGRFPAVDPATGAALPAVLDAPFQAAEALRSHGDGARADSVLRAAELRWQRTIALQPRGARAVAELWLRVGRARAARGESQPALEALRRALAEPGGRRRRTVLALAETALDAGLADTALAYARWAERDFVGEPRTQAMLLVGRAWEAKGPIDSALAAYARVLDDLPGAPGGAQARFRRGVLLERAGRWDLALGEYRTLAARYPMHALAIESLERIVAWYLRSGERDLARIEARRGIERLEEALNASRNDATLRQARDVRARLRRTIDRLERTQS